LNLFRPASPEDPGSWDDQEEKGSPAGISAAGGRWLAMQRQDGLTSSKNLNQILAISSEVPNSMTG
jgi:hypothetical protein